MMRSLPILGISIGVALTQLSCGSAGSLGSARQALATPIVATASSTELRAMEVDRLLRSQWQALGIVPAAPVDDLGFLRRVSLDVIGRIPTVDEITRFEADAKAARRGNVVDALLASPTYAEHWTNYWEDVLLLDKVDAKFVDRDEFRGFLHAQFSNNAAWSQIVRALIAARGVNRQAPAAAGGDVDAAMAPMGTPAAGSDRTNGAVSWLLQYRETPQDLAGKTASTFLGVKIQCAQCHDHKTEKWKQLDFQRFASCFTHMKAIPIEWAADGSPQRVELFEISKPAYGGAKGTELGQIASAPPITLDGTDLSDAGDRREALADWTTSPQNPWFARAFVNRMWGYFLGRGFVEPVDDFRASNPAQLPVLLDHMAADFAASGYDIKRLIKMIVSTEAYRVSATPGHIPTKGQGDDAGKPPAAPSGLWSRFPLKPLAPDELLDSIALATDLDEFLPKKNADELTKARAQVRRQFTFLFDVDEESHAAIYEGTIPQALMLMNGRAVNQTLRVGRAGALLKILATPESDELRIEALYLRTVSRRPTPEELRVALSLVQVRGSHRHEAFEDVLWALLNSAEFVFNH